MEVNIPHQFDPTQNPYSYQLKILSNPARFKSLVLHRKAGKTALAVNQLILSSQLNPKKVHWYVGPTYKQAKETVWRDPEMLSKYVPKEIIESKNATELTITFKNGSVLGVKGADDPDSLRGPNPFGVILDEFPLHKPQVWEEIIQPIMRANPLAWTWFVGTPKPQGAHAKKIHDTIDSWSDGFSFTLNATDSGIIIPEELEKARATMTQAGFEQEFLCVWHSEGGVVFRGIDRCVYDGWTEEKQIPDARCKYQFGIDLAMHEDWTVIIGVNRNTRKVEYFDRFNKLDYDLQSARIEAALRKYNNPPCNIDMTGVGEPVVQSLQRKGLAINGIKFTNEIKHSMVKNLMLLIEQGKIKLPRQEDLLHELQIFGYEITPARNIRYGAPEGFHDDTVTALMLASWELGTQFAPQQQMPTGSIKTTLKFS